MRHVVLVPLVVLVACSSGGGAAPGTVPVLDPRPEARDYVIDDKLDEDVTIHRLDVSADDAFNSLADVYTSLGLGPVQLDARSRRVGIREFRLPRRLVGERPSKFLLCGDGLAGPVANRSRIELTMRTTAQASDGATELRTEMQAIAQPTDATQADRRCSSTRELEVLIADRVLSEAGPGSAR